MSTLTAQVEAASTASDGLEYIGRVKSAVTEELCSLDRTLRLEDTKYFNHSAIPDFVASWPETGEKRDIYLRAGYQSILDADELVRLSPSGSMMVALHAEAKEDGPPLHAIDSFEGDPSTDPGPLAPLLRANFTRGARGVLDSEAAENLIIASTQGDVQLAAAIDLRFDEAARTRLGRTVAIVNAVLSDDVVASTLNSVGRLSQAELEEIIPWLLTTVDPDGTRSSLWEYVGSLLDLEALNKIGGGRLDGLDLSALIKHNSRRWTGRITYLGYAAQSEAQSNEARGVWRKMNNRKALSCDVFDRRFEVAVDQRSVLTRDGSGLPLWTDLQERAAGIALHSIDLRGIERSLRITAEQSTSIRDDIEQAVSSLGDSYRVSDIEVVVTSPDTEEPVICSVDFSKGTVTASAGSAALYDLVRLAGIFLDPTLASTGEWSLAVEPDPDLSTAEE